MSFCMFMKVDVIAVEVMHVILFMEFLCRNGLTVNVIRNYLAGITMFYKWLGLNFTVFSNDRVKMMFTALGKSVYKSPTY